MEIDTFKKYLLNLIFYYNPINTKSDFSIKPMMQNINWDVL